MTEMLSKEQFVKAKRIRGGHRAHLTSTLNLCEESLQSYSPDRHDLRLKLKQLKITLEDKLKTLKTLDDQILQCVDEEGEIEEEITEAGKLKDSVYEVLVKIDDVLTRSEPSTSSSSTNNNNTGANANVVRGAKAKLPKLELKKFDGEAYNWQEFWDAFNSSIHENKDLNKVDKFNYLKSMLEGSAYATIAGISLTEANYDIAVNLLKERYAQKQVIINSHIDNILKLDPVSNSQAVSELRRFYDKIETHCRGLAALGVEYSSYGTVLVNIIFQKLPEDIKLIISRKLGNDEWKIQDLLDILNNELKAREKCLSSNATRHVQDQRQPARHRNQHNFPATRNTHARDDNSIPATASALLTTQITCVFCKGEHYSDKCNVITSLQERRNVLKREGRCFLCLRRAKHLARECQSSKKCFHCKGNHHAALCEKRTSSIDFQSTEESRKQDTSQTKERSTNQPNNTTFRGINPESNVQENSVLLQTAMAEVCNPQDKDRKTILRIIIDPGSQRTYITKGASQSLQLPIRNTENIVIKTFGNDDDQSLQCNLVNLRVKSLQSQFTLDINALEVPFICSPLQGQAVKWAKNHYPHLQNLQLADYTASEQLHVNILLGSDTLWRVVTGDVRKGVGEGPVAIETHLGWVLSGPVTVPQNRLSSVNFNATHVLNVCTPTDINIDTKINQLFDLESLGIKEKEPVHEVFERDIVFENGHYTVKLPWREHHDILPANFDLSAGRLTSVLKRLRNDDELLQTYDKVIHDQIDSGIVEAVHPNLENVETGKVHYLSHHAVIRKEASTTKVRVVMDASAKEKPNSPSLNDCLHTGPSLLPNIIDILLRFRWHRVPLVADIEKAFHMIHVDEEDRNALRFLWIQDVNSERPKLMILRFCRIVFGLNCSPFLLEATLRHHITNFNFQDPAIANKLIQDMYVDDLVTGSDTVEDAVQTYTNAKECLSSGGFNLRKWRTSNTSLMNIIETDLNNTEVRPELSKVVSDQTTYAQQMIGEPQELKESHHKVLGVKWNLLTDTIVLDFERLVETSKALLPTKRNLLKLSAMFFDPLGLISPVILQLKILIQDICTLEIDWDTPMNEELQRRWKNIFRDIGGAQVIEIPRFYCYELTDTVEQYTLHGFCDASTKAYCAVVYILIKSGSGYRCRFVTSKTRVAPQKKLTIPRLELMAALILARLMNSVKTALQTQASLYTFFWSDSQIVLAWLKNDQTFKQFVSNRIKEILQLTSPDMWNYCPTATNPADIGSRGLPATQLKESELWWNGPDWIAEPQSWPNQKREDNLQSSDDYREELKKEKTAVLINANDESSLPNIDKVIDPTTYSSANTLYRVTAYVLRFIANLKSKNQLGEKNDIELNCTEIQRAETTWIKCVQRSLKNDRNFEQLQTQLGLYEDTEGIVRCRGRIGNSELRFETKFPILMPRDHHLTTLVILQSHNKVFHHGLKSTLNEFRSKYWMTKAKQKIKMMLSRCTTCRRFESIAYKYPPKTHLPEYRVKGQTAFLNIGTDLAGPLFARNTLTEKTSFKVWIVIFTCTLSRAVHLEIMRGMNVEQFLMAFRRFVSRRGTPALIISDNAKNFKSADSRLKSLYRQPEVKRYLSGKRIEWKNILPKAPWQGGFYERLIKTVKRCLKKTLRNAKTTVDELYTLLVEIEQTVNNRPLTYINMEEFETPLTPSHLICGRRLDSLPDESVDDTETNISPEDLTKRQKHLGNLISHSWKRWRDDYLVQLRETHDLTGKRGGTDVIKEGDVVIVHDDDKPRGQWRMGKVVKIRKSSDGKIRGASLRVVSKTGRATTISRPVNKLYPLEVQDIEPETDERPLDTTPELPQTIDNPDSNQQRTRPRRAAAMDADFMRRLRLSQ